MIYDLLSKVLLSESPMEGRYGDKGDMEMILLRPKAAFSSSPYLPHPPISLPMPLEAASSRREYSGLSVFSVSLCLCG